MKRILHIADVHLDPSNFENTIPALDAFTHRVEEEKPDAVVFAGDLFISPGRLNPTADQVAKIAFQRMGNVCPVVCVVGNHDIAKAWGETDSVTAALDRLKTKHPIHVFSRPSFIDVAGIRFFGLPYPSKYHFLSQTEEDVENVNEAISAELAKVVQGFKADLHPENPNVLIYHGTVAGGQADNEQLMSTGVDIAIDRRAAGDSFDACMAGHLHRPQEVGRWVYSGAPAPLAFGMEGVEPGFCLWTFQEDDEVLPADFPVPEAGWTGEDRYTCFQRIPLPVAHQLLTINIGPEDCETISPTAAVIARAGELVEAIDGAKIRIKARIPESRLPEWNEETIREILKDARDVKIVTERISPIKLRAEEVSIDKDIATLLGKWVDLNPDTEELRDELIALAQAVESEIPPELRLNPNGSDYRPLRISWENFKQYHSGEIDFDRLGRLVCISGPNFAGKSNAAETEAFVLYKFLRGSSNLKDVVRNGETSCKVAAEFTAQQEHWRITRTVKISGSGKASGDVLLERDGPGKWTAANAGTGPETDRKIQELVGPPSLYFATKYASQFDIDRLLNMKPSELKDTLQQAVNTRLFDVRSQIAREMKWKIEAEESRAQAKVEQLRQQIEKRTDLKNELECCNGVRHETEKALGIHAKALGLTQENIKKREQEWSALNEKKRQYEKLTKKVKDAADEIETLQAKIDKLESVLTVADEIGRQVEQMAALDRLLLEFTPNREAFDAIGREVDSAKRKIEEKNRDHEADIEKVRQQIRIDNEAAETVDMVPCGGKGEYASCRFITKAVKARQEIPALKKTLDDMKKARETIITKEVAALQKIEHSQEKIGYDPGAHKKKQSELIELKDGRWEEKAQALARSGGELESHREFMRVLIDSLKQAKTERDSHEVDDIKWAEVSNILEELQEEERRTNEAIENTRSTLTTLITQAGEINGQLKSIEDATRELQRLQAASEKGVRSLRVVSVYLRAVSRDGLPFLILEQSIPELAKLTNDFLGDAPLHIEIEPLRDLANGEVRDQVVIWFFDAKGRHPLSEASGYQRMQLGAAIRGALATIQARTNGAKVHHFFIDEGFGAYEQENLIYGKEMLKRFADTFEKVLYITHVPEMQEIAETRLEVIPEADGNRIEVVN